MRKRLLTLQGVRWPTVHIWPTTAGADDAMRLFMQRQIEIEQSWILPDQRYRSSTGTSSTKFRGGSISPGGEFAFIIEDMLPRGGPNPRKQFRVLRLGMSEDAHQVVAQGLLQSQMQSVPVWRMSVARKTLVLYQWQMKPYVYCSLSIMISY